MTVFEAPSVDGLQVKLQSFEAFFALVVITNAIFIGFDAWSTSIF